MKETLFTADSYKDWKRLGEPYDKNGKLYTKVKKVCNKCNGTGIAISHVENGVPIPYMPDNGICYGCEGKGFFNKEVRLYTETEYKKMVATNEANRIKREQNREAKMRAEFAKNKDEWIEKEGFSNELKTYIVTGDSYSIKEKLKKEGFIYSPILKWHRATPSETYNCIEIDAAEVLDWTAWGKGIYKTGAIKLIQAKLDALIPPSTSEWIGEKQEKIYDLPVKLINIRGYESYYGAGRIYTFETEEKNIIKWFTSSNPKLELEDKVLMTATIKEHSEYKGEKSTIVTRPKFIK